MSDDPRRPAPTLIGTHREPISPHNGDIQRVTIAGFSVRLIAIFLRGVIIFVLGIALIIYSMVTPGHDIPFLITGLILIGIIPIEDWLARYPHNKRVDDAAAKISDQIDE